MLFGRELLLRNSEELAKTLLIFYLVSHWHWLGSASSSHFRERFFFWLVVLVLLQMASDNPFLFQFNCTTVHGMLHDHHLLQYDSVP
jgi:hypothetical protein